MKKQGRLFVENLESKRLLSVVPNDAKVDSQWSIKSLSLNQAWQYSTGSKDVVVAVIDSGIDLNHEDLRNNVWKNIGEIANNGIDDEGNGFIDDVNGWNFFSNTNNVQDNYGHGTHVAGIIGAQGNNSLGVAGINWNVSIMPLKCISDVGTGWLSSTLAAIDYVLMMKNTFHVNIVVVNNSWNSGPGFSLVVDNRIKLLNDSNIIFVSAAGNNNTDNDISPTYPGSYNQPNVINVASLSSETNGLTRSSNYGKTTVDIAAPGSVILSTLSHNTYGYLSGTSMAAPQVAGAVALLNAVKPHITVAETIDAIFSEVDKIPELLNKVVTNGKLNIAASVFKVLGMKYEHTTISNPVVVVVPKVIAPIAKVESFSLTRVRGWAFSSKYGASPVIVRVVINNRVVATQWANQFKSGLYKTVGSSKHGFNISLNPRWFKKGYNNVSLQVLDPVSKQVSIVWTGRVRR